MISAAVYARTSKFNFKFYACACIPACLCAYATHACVRERIRVRIFARSIATLQKGRGCAVGAVMISTSPADADSYGADAMTAGCDVRGIDAFLALFRTIVFKPAALAIVQLH